MAPVPLPRSSSSRLPGLLQLRVGLRARFLAGPGEPAAAVEVDAAVAAANGGWTIDTALLGSASGSEPLGMLPSSPERKLAPRPLRAACPRPVCRPVPLRREPDGLALPGSVDPLGGEPLPALRFGWLWLGCSLGLPLGTCEPDCGTSAVLRKASAGDSVGRAEEELAFGPLAKPVCPSWQ